MVSIVIPCYNSNGTIQKAVNSVLSQGYKNTEIIIVEDGSDEPSCPKAGWLRRRKIKRFSKQHEGPGTARNLGVEHAAGEYILFLDADDELYVGAIANMLHYAVRHGLDIVAGVTLRESVDEKLSVSNKQLFTKNHIDKSATRDILYFDTVSTNKLYRADFLAANSIRFGPGLYEDMAFTAQAYSLADRIGIISLYVYRWMLRGAGSSVTHTLDIDNLRSRIDALNEQYRYIPEYLRCRWLAFFLYRHMDIYMKQFDTYSEAARKEMYESMRGFFALYRRHYYPKYFRRPLKRLLAESILQGEYGLFCSIGHIEAQAFGYS
jgi:glycosyltransferase involved in cell wall biosynthesis